LRVESEELRIDTFIRLALTGTTEQSQAGQSLNPEKENNSQLSTLNSQLTERNSQLSTLNSQLTERNSQLTEKVAVQIDTERLKFIDELSRLIMELKKQFPEIAQYLSKARDNVSANTENIPVKNLMNLLNAVQQNLSAFAKIEKPEIAETIRNLVGEIIKILQPSSENPPEQKLIQALSKNDFANANIAIKNIVEAAIAQNTQPETKMQQIPQQIPQQISQQTSQQAPLQQVPLQQIPLQQVPMQQVQQQVPRQVQQQIQQVQQVPQTPALMQTPQTPQTPQATANIQQTFQIILNALQELKELGLPKELQNAPLKELETIALQKTGIEIPKDLVKNLSMAFGEKPVFATVNFTPVMIRVMPEAQTPHLPQVPQTHQTLQTQQIPQTQQMPQMPETVRVPETSQIEIPTPAPTHTTAKNINTVNTNLPLPPNTTFEIPLPKNFPLKIPPNHKIEMAFSLYQIPAKNETKNDTKLVLQPWIASVQIPKEERGFWLKTDLPLTPQTLNIREEILSFGKLPESPEPVRLFASGMHELSLQTERGANVSKEHTNLLWRVVQNPQIMQTQTQSLPPQVVHTLLKYQPLGNYEGDLFKNLPEPVKRELLQELPAGKTWQPETLQKAVEKVLAKYTEQQPQAQTANWNEHTSKAHEEIKNTLQNLKEQVQWTRIDQDTRLQNDKENVFYFMHGNELQKGRLKVKDERKGSSKHRQDSSISFSIEIKAKNLGNVHADLTLSKNILTIRMQDEFGTAGDAVKEERETLAKELADVGITLGELLYGKTPKIQNLPIAKKENKSSSGLDVRA